MMWKDLPTPCYVVDEGKIRKNLEILADLEQECGCHGKVALYQMS